MLYQPPTGGAANDPYVGANPGLGVQGSRVPPKGLEYPQREIVNAITSSGQTASDADLFQLWKAMKLAGGVAFRGASMFTASGIFDPSALGLTALDRILVLVWGGGGGGASTISSAGSGGAGGGLAIKSLDCPASSVTVTVGAGGAGNNVGSTGGPGGTSSFGAYCSATGGSGGAGGSGPGGIGVGGSINLSGGAGADLINFDQYWAIGGSAPFMGPGLLNNSGQNPIGSGGCATLAPTADAGHAGAVIVFY